MNRARILFILVTLALVAPAGAAFAVDTGSADFTRFVSMGDSLTAGFTSSSLIQSSQVRDYPALIAQQAGVADFQQPLVSAPGIPGIKVLASLVPLNVVTTATQGHPLNLNLQRPYNNLGVPGATVNQLLNTVTDHGGIFDLILRGLGTQIQQALVQRPTFVTLWIGNNDVLNAVGSGIVIEGVTVTPLASFTHDYQQLAALLKGSGAKLAFANIPDVTSIPLVTTIPPVVVNPNTQQPVLGPSGAPIPLIGPNGALRPGDHVLLFAASDLAKGLGIPSFLPGGTGKPLPANDVLTIEETQFIQQRTNDFNKVIAQAASDAGAALVDVNALLTQLNATGIEVGGIPFTSAYLTGGVFSYDGVHPTAFGYAFVANAFIAAINKQFGGHIPPANMLPPIFTGQGQEGLARVGEPGEGGGRIPPPGEAPPPPETGGVRMATWVPAIFSEEARKEFFAVMGWPTEEPVAPPPGRRPRD